MNALADKRSFCCEFTLGDRYEAGYRIKMAENNVYEIALWLNTYHVPFIRFESINRGHLEYYNHVIGL